MKKILIGLIAVLLVVVGLSSLVVTREDEYTLVRRFGKIDHVEMEAGLSFKTPFLDSVDKLPKQTLIYDLPASDVITKDKKSMITDSYVLWKIIEPVKFAQTLNSSVANAENRLSASVYSAMKNVISSMTQNEVIDSRDGELTTQVLAYIGDGLTQYGIEVLTVDTKRLDLPSDNKEAVYQRMISERQKIAKTYTAEGEAQAKIIRNTTDKEVAITVSNAEAEAASIIVQGEEEYMKIMAEAYGDPAKAEFYSYVRALDAAKASLTGDNNTLILPSNSPIAKIFIGE